MMILSKQTSNAMLQGMKTMTKLTSKYPFYLNRYLFKFSSLNQNNLNQNTQSNSTQDTIILFNYSIEEQSTLLSALEKKLSSDTLTRQQLDDIVSKRFFSELLEQIQTEQEQVLGNDDNSTLNRLENLETKVIQLLTSKKLTLLNTFKLMEQTIQLHSVQKYFLEKIVCQGDRLNVSVHGIHCFLKFFILHDSLLTRSPAIDFKQISNLIQIISEKTMLSSFSVQELSLLLQIDQHFLRSQIQLAIISQIEKNIKDTIIPKNASGNNKNASQTDDSKNQNILQGQSQTHSVDQQVGLSSRSYVNALLEILKFLRSKNLKLDISILNAICTYGSIDVAASVFKLVKLTSYQHNELVKLYLHVHATRLKTYDANNIKLLSVMHYYMPQKSACMKYCEKLAQLLDSGDYVELIKLLPYYIESFHPAHPEIQYYCDRVQIKLATSIYSEMMEETDQSAKIEFIGTLAKFLVGLLHGDLFKNDYFLLKTFDFLLAQVNLINKKRSVSSKLLYLANQVADGNAMGVSESIQSLAKQLVASFPEHNSKQIQSNTQNKIFKFLLQTNHFALQNIKIGSFIIDIFVHPDIIVEYNGFDHYKFDVKQKDFNQNQFVLQHSYREKRLKALQNFKVANIHFNQWHNLQELEKQYKFLNEVILKLE